jgi:hypothetical protein
MHRKVLFTGPSYVCNKGSYEKYTSHCKQSRFVNLGQACKILKHCQGHLVFAVTFSRTYGLLSVGNVAVLAKMINACM